jgi:hypothetical protein
MESSLPSKGKNTAMLSAAKLLWCTVMRSAIFVMRYAVA